MELLTAGGLKQEADQPSPDFTRRCGGFRAAQALSPRRENRPRLRPRKAGATMRSTTTSGGAREPYHRLGEISFRHLFHQFDHSVLPLPANLFQVRVVPHPGGCACSPATNRFCNKEMSTGGPTETLLCIVASERDHAELHRIAQVGLIATIRDREWACRISSPDLEERAIPGRVDAVSCG